MKKRWAFVTDEDIRRHFKDEEKSYGGIAQLYEGATIGKVAGRCRKLKLVRGTSPSLGSVRPGRGSPVRPPVSLPPKPKPAKVMAAVVEKPKREIAVVSIVAARQKALKKPFKRGKVRLEDLESGSCRWPCGDPQEKDFGFCGSSQAPGTPYCAEHHKVSHVRDYKLKKQGYAFTGRHKV